MQRRLTGAVTPRRAQARARTLTPIRIPRSARLSGDTADLPPTRRRAARHAVMALLALGGLTAMAGCAAGAPPSARSASVAPSVPAPTTAPSPSGNTGEVCQKINATVAGDLSAFGVDVGNYAGHQTGKNTDAAKKSKASALGRLTSLAGKVRAAGQLASVPALGAAANTTAGNLERLAADPALLAGVHAAADIPPVIQKVTAATDPLINACV